MAMLTQGVATTRAFWLGTGLGGTWTFKISKNTGGFGAPTSNVVTSMGNGFYYVALSTTDTNTVGELAYAFTGGTGTVTQPQSDQVYTDPLALVKNDGSATLSLTELVITNSGGPAVNLSGTTYGIECAASAGVGLAVTGTTDGVTITGSAGPGLAVTGSTSGASMVGQGGLGVVVQGSTSGASISGASADGLSINGVGGIGIALKGLGGYGFFIQGTTAGTFCTGTAGPGVHIDGSTDGVDVTATAGTVLALTSTAGQGITITSSGIGINVAAASGFGVEIVAASGIALGLSGSTYGAYIVGTTAGLWCEGVVGQGVIIDTQTAPHTALAGAALGVYGVGAGIDCQASSGPAASIVSTLGVGTLIQGTTDALTLTPGSGDAINYAGTDLLTAIADKILTFPNGIETGYTPQQALRLMFSALCALTSVSGDVRTFRDVNNTVNRIVATTDVSGQRLVVTLTP